MEATDGFEVVGEVETGEASVDAAHELDPDLVLMDVNLPGSTAWRRPGGSSPRPPAW